MITKPKLVEERDTLDLLELVCQLHSRSLNQPGNKDMHDAYVEARQEMERRIKVNKNLALSNVNSVSVEIEDRDIATVEVLHDLLIDGHGYSKDFDPLERARELTAKMYRIRELKKHIMNQSKF